MNHRQRGASWLLGHTARQAGQEERGTARFANPAAPHYMAAMADTALMPIPGRVDPLPVQRPGVVDGVTPREDGRTDLIGLPRARIAALFENAGLDAKAAKLRAKQVFHWLYHRGVTDFAEMTDIAKTMRPWLADRFVLGRPEVVEAQHSADGTRKWLLRTADGHDFEMVFIPDADRGTLCVSSQVGCTLNCRFCHTGTMRLVRNLTAGEIVGQVMLARDALGAWSKVVIRRTGACLPTSS
jgi:23S rRNA (adenine2503-C2)-methyltransferase